MFKKIALFCLLSTPFISEASSAQIKIALGLSLSANVFFIYKAHQTLQKITTMKQQFIALKAQQLESTMHVDAIRKADKERFYTTLNRKLEEFEASKPRLDSPF